MRYLFMSSLVSITLLGMPVIGQAEGTSQHYMSYANAITQILANGTNNKEGLRNRFPFDPELFDSKNIKKKVRKAFVKPTLGRSDATFSDWRLPAEGDRPGVFSKPTTGGVDHPDVKQPALGDDHEYRY